MADRNQISFADEQMGFAECDAVAVELRGARHDEQRIAILFDLRPLVGVVGVLDREIVQFELPLYAAQQRHVRFVQPDPHHMARLAAPARGFLNGDVGDAPAIDIRAGRDDTFGADGLGRSRRLWGLRSWFPSLNVVAESCLEATFFGKASTGNSAVNTIGASAVSSPCAPAINPCVNG